MSENEILKEILTEILKDIKKFNLKEIKFYIDSFVLRRFMFHSRWVKNEFFDSASK